MPVATTYSHGNHNLLVVGHGEELPYCGGIQVIHTPGHTPGHISLYLKQSKTLVAGDAFIVSGGILQGPPQQSTPDMETALRSLEKFLDFEIESVICYHGGLSRGNAKERLLSLSGKISNGKAD